MRKSKMFIFGCICMFLFGCKKSDLKDVPVCIQKIISQYLNQPKDSRPNSITEYFYNGSFVYYIRSGCCDQYNPVYNDNCNYLGSPDGGFTGKGDFKLPNFFNLATSKRVVWENK